MIVKIITKTIVFLIPDIYNVAFNAKSNLYGGLYKWQDLHYQEMFITEKAA